MNMEESGDGSSAAPNRLFMAAVAVVVTVCVDGGDVVCGEVGVRALEVGRLPIPVEFGEVLSAAAAAAGLLREAPSGLTIDIIDSAKDSQFGQVHRDLQRAEV